MTDGRRFRTALLGKRVSHVWRGHGSALFLEFGSLTVRRKRDGRVGHPQGELTLGIEWSWRIENRSSILGGSWSAERGWPTLFKKLKGRKVTSVDIFGMLPEIAVSLSNGLKVISFMTADGQPSWSLVSHSPSIGSLSVRRGKLHAEENDS